MQEPTFVLPTMDAIRRWQGVSPPNAAARRALAELGQLITAMEALRGQLPFEAEPADFDEALRECRAP